MTNDKGLTLTACLLITSYLCTKYALGFCSRNPPKRNVQKHLKTSIRLYVKLDLKSPSTLKEGRCIQIKRTPVEIGRGSCHIKIYLSITLRQLPGRLQDVRWAHGRVSRKRSSCQPLHRTSQMWVRHHVRRRYQYAGLDEPCDHSQLPS